MGKSKPRKPGWKKAAGGLPLVPIALTLLLLVALAALAIYQMDSAVKPAGPGPKAAATFDAAPDAPGGATVDGTCEDRHAMCEPWHKVGACRRARRADAPSPTEMAKLCPRVCGLCPGNVGRVAPVPQAARCRRDNLSAAVPSGRLAPLFERLLTDFPEYSPVALSTDPYVVQLHNFVTAEERAAFQEVCRPHFERSLAGDQLNPVRTSFQCWCNFADCFMNEDVHRVVRRINHVTGTGYNNGEDMQIVRYEPGQFYKVHHDQNTAVWAPQGPRVLTFFMYLNEVDGGGETFFPSLRNADGSQGLLVQPHAGSAILWPSTLDAEPMRADGRTDHEARPVTQGIKYGANMWIHQFDFKTPSERGCPLTYVNTMGPRPRNPEHIKLVHGYVPEYKEG